MDYNRLFNNNSMNPNTPEGQIAINVALVNALGETQDIIADSTNPFHKNSYASLSKHLEILKPIFKKHGLGILQFPIGDNASVGIRTASALVLASFADTVVLSP